MTDAMEPGLAGFFAQDSEDVVIGAHGRGDDRLAYVTVPKAWATMTAGQRKTLGKLQETQRLLDALEHDRGNLVRLARSRGIAWSAIGLTTSMTSEGARLKWGTR